MRSLAVHTACNRNSLQTFLYPVHLIEMTIYQIDLSEHPSRGLWKRGHKVALPSVLHFQLARFSQSEFNMVIFSDSACESKTQVMPLLSVGYQEKVVYLCVIKVECPQEFIYCQNQTPISINLFLSAPT